MSEIKVYKSLANDFFVLQKDNDHLFYFTKEDLDSILEELTELKEDLAQAPREIKINCYVCDMILELFDDNTCYCKKCERIFVENEIRKNCGI